MITHSDLHEQHMLLFCLSLDQRCRHRGARLRDLEVYARHLLGVHPALMLVAPHHEVQKLGEQVLVDGGLGVVLGSAG